MKKLRAEISTCLWFDGQAEEAARFYTSLFEDSEILSTSHYTKSLPGKEGSVLLVTFRLGDHHLQALNGGPDFKFSEAVSLSVRCETQEEIDSMWTRLTADGGEEGQCGWLKDKFGLSWQIVPAIVLDLLAEGDADPCDRMMQALMKMKKLNIAELKAAYEGQATPIS